VMNLSGSAADHAAVFRHEFQMLPVYVDLGKGEWK
jgi:hypothetical protein